MGSGITLQIALNHPEMINKMVLASVSYNSDGMHPGMMEGMEMITPEMFVGSPWHTEYMELAPNTDDFPALVTKVSEMNTYIPVLTDEQIQQISAPTLLIIGDSDIVRPEHSVEFFRLLGGGVNGDMAGLPKSQLAVLPGTSHTMVVDRANLIAPMVSAFLETPVAEN
jgi:pimeloyl-ACP methyl ester carboxylesterase